MLSTRASCHLEHHQCRGDVLSTEAACKLDANCTQAHRPWQRVHCGIAESLHASSNGVNASTPARPVLDSHAWDATYMQAPLAQPYRPPKLPQAPNRLRIFAGTSNPVRDTTLHLPEQSCDSRSQDVATSRVHEWLCSVSPVQSVFPV